jgi:integrase
VSELHSSEIWSVALFATPTGINETPVNKPPDNPMTKVKRTAPKICEEVDPRVVADPAQVRRLLTAVTYVGQRNRDRGAHLSAFFAVGYYAAARPAEELALREQDCTLPAQGWGELALGESRPAAGKRWTDSGEVHDRRGLKHRGAKDVRIVPIPPVLVDILREHLAPTARARMGGCSARRTVAWSGRPRTTGCGRRPGCTR